MVAPVGNAEDASGSAAQFTGQPGQVLVGGRLELEGYCPSSVRVSHKPPYQGPVGTGVVDAESPAPASGGA